MARRNLSRTAIEGGRSKYPRNEEAEYTRQERRQINMDLARAKVDHDAADEVFTKVRKAAYKEFDDKLSPVYRWIEAQVGRPWNDVFSEITKKFSTRSLAGRHIVGHVNSYIRMEWHDHTHYANFIVGEDGILRKDEPRRTHFYGTPSEPADKVLLREVNKLLDGGYHKQLNSFIKLEHSGGTYEYHNRIKHQLDPYARTWVKSEMGPRLLAGKHDLDQFIKDILSGFTEGFKKSKERHYEWKKSVENFIQAVKPR
jgi:hypothetical protein